MGFDYNLTWLIPVGIVGVILLIIIIIKSVQSFNIKKLGGYDSLIGSTGLAHTDIKPKGKVKVSGEIWEAVAKENVPKGATVKVVDVKDRLRIVVEKYDEII